MFSWPGVLTMVLSFRVESFSVDKLLAGEYDLALGESSNNQAFTICGRKDYSDRWRSKMPACFNFVRHDP